MACSAVHISVAVTAHIVRLNGTRRVMVWKGMEGMLILKNGVLGYVPDFTVCTNEKVQIQHILHTQ